MENLPVDEMRTVTIDDLIPSTIRKPRKPKKPYRKPKSIIQLEEDWKVWHYSKTKIPEEIQHYKRFSDSSTNNLTKAIIAWFECNGWYASRRNTQGTYNVALGRFIKSGSTKGAEDIDGMIAGRVVKVEVKFGRDKMSQDQKRYRENIINAGGFYIVAKTFDHFMSEISKVIDSINSLR